MNLTLYTYQDRDFALPDYEIFTLMSPRDWSVGWKPNLYSMQVKRELKLEKLYTRKTDGSMTSTLPEFYEKIMREQWKWGEDIVRFKTSHRGPFVARMRELGNDGFISNIPNHGWYPKIEVVIFNPRDVLTQPVDITDAWKRVAC